VIYAGDGICLTKMAHVVAMKKSVCKKKLINNRGKPRGGGKVNVPEVG